MGRGLLGGLHAEPGEAGWLPLSQPPTRIAPLQVRHGKSGQTP